MIWTGAWWAARWALARAWGGRNPEAVQWLAVLAVGLLVLGGWTWWHRDDAAHDAVAEAVEDSRRLTEGIIIEMEGGRDAVDHADDDDLLGCARSRGLLCDALDRGR